MKGCECDWTYHQAAGTETPKPSPENLVIVNPPKPEPVSICVCGHKEKHHSRFGEPLCWISDCLCDHFTEDTGATIEANKTPWLLRVFPRWLHFEKRG